MRAASLCFLICLCSCLAAGAGEVKFSNKPKAAKSNAKVKITFTASASTDVEVAILDARGKVVRHLAAGVIGGQAKAAAPLKAGLAQSIEWDLRDNAGKPASGGPFRARVALGMQAKLNKTIGGSPYAFGCINGVATDKRGRLYVFHVGCYKADGIQSIQVHAPDGKYLKTIMPAPANLALEKVKAYGAIDMGDGTWGFENFGGGRFPQFYPGLGGPKKFAAPILMPVVVNETLLLHDGYSARSGGKGQAFFIGTDGTPPAGMPYRRSLWSKEYRGSWSSIPNTAKAGAQCAVSPDGKYLYVGGPYSLEKKVEELKKHKKNWKKLMPRGGLYRIKLGASGPTELIATLDASISVVATGADGRIYVGDRARDRILVLDPGGKKLGEVAIKDVSALAVHPKTAELYAITRSGKRRSTRFTLVKLSSAKAGGRELARLDVGGAGHVAIAVSGGKTTVWCGGGISYMAPSKLLRIADTGNALKIEEDLCERAAGSLPNGVDRAALDRQRGEIYVNNCFSTLYRCDVKSGKTRKLNFLGTDVAVGTDGNLYVMGGLAGREFTEASMHGWRRVTREGKPAPFENAGSHAFPKGNYARHGAGYSSKGICPAPGGKTYVVDMYGWNLYWVTAYSPQGKFLGGPRAKGRNKTRPAGSLIDNIPNACGGLKVDRAGNIYVGVVGVPKNFKFPGNMEKKSKTCRAMMGSVVKFPPTGGTFWQVSVTKKSKRPRPAGPGVKLFEKAWHSTSEVFAAGALQAFPGTSPTSVHGSCACRTPRFELDDYGRLYLPDAISFRVRIYDAAGNPIRTIGSYGNFDSNGAKSLIPKPEIAFGAPLSVAWNERDLYVSDMVNRRMVAVKLSYAAEETVAIR
jgi:hypothetical protein